MMNIRVYFRAGFLLTVFTGLLLTQAAAFSSGDRIFNDISFKRSKDRSTITVFFNFPVRYLRHYPLNNGKEVRIQFEPILMNTDSDVTIKKRESLPPPANNPEGVVRIEFEGIDPRQPALLVVFDEPRNFDAAQGDDYRSLAIHLPVENGATALNQSASEVPIHLETSDDQSDEDNQAFSIRRPGEMSKEQEQQLLEEGARVMAEKNYSRAIQVYTKLLDSQNPEVLETTQFQLALAREYKGHLAHARFEYENYLKNFPSGAKADEAKNRLANLLGPLPTTPGKYPGGEEVKDSRWKNEFYGSISIYYDRDNSYWEDRYEDLEEEVVTNIDSLFTGIDATWQLRSDKLFIETTAIGSLENDFIENRNDEKRINSLHIDLENNRKSVDFRLGRQSSSKGGVFGHFDGARFGYRLHDKIRLNLVAGYPVERSSAGLDTEKHFCGVNFDLGSFSEHWHFNTYLIDQINDGINDRRAVGVEIRYIGNRGSFFTLGDYDILYDEVGIFLFSGNYLFSNDRTRINVSADVRKIPILSTGNALIGQFTPTLGALIDKFGEESVRQLARDRTLASSYFTMGLSHSLTDKIQIAADIAWSKIEGAPASAGVGALASTGDEYYCSLQFTGSSLFRSNDLSTLSLRYAFTRYRDTSTLLVRTRYPISERWRISPKLQIDYRKNNLHVGDQWQYRPGLRMEFFLSKSWRFEIEGEYSYSDKQLIGLATERKGYTYSIGSRWDF